jgi:LysM repeat protein
MDSPNRPARVVWHTTESGAGNAAFNSVGKYLTSIGAEPHFLYDPTTDRLGQYGPLDQSARALKNDGNTRTNRTGRACIQIEVLGRAATPFTGYWRPGKNFKALMSAIRSWGIPDVFPMGTPAKTASATKRDRSVWLAKGGHYGHCNVPGNDHWDPGAINTAALFAAAPKASGGSSSGSSSSGSSSSSTYVVKAGDTLSGIGSKLGIKWQSLAELNGIKSPYTLAVGQKLKTKAASASVPTVSLANVLEAARKDPKAAQGKASHASDVKPVEAALKAAGYLAAAYASDGSFGSVTVTAYAKWQKAMGYSGTAADGIPGKASLVALGNKYGFKVK